MADEVQINLRQLIPIAAGTALLVLGCSAERAAAHRYCKQWEECDASSFNDRYDSVGQCTKAQKKWYRAENYNYKVTESPECGRASRTYDTCWSKTLTCDRFSDDSEDYEEWQADFEDECRSEISDFEDECLDSPSYSYDYY